ncbi:MAG: M23 family metallopeptidase, partial [Acidimicrobiales bacterium]
MPRALPRALLAVCCLAVGGAAFAVPVAAGAPPPFVPPVEAPVVDPFRAPASRYGPGNRGLEYGTAPGTVVRAVGDGRVTFAGSVAGTLHVTVLHPDGVRTTASFLARVDVTAGQQVEQGQAIGTTVGHLHLGAHRAVPRPLVEIVDGGLGLIEACEQCAAIGQDHRAAVVGQLA